MAEAGLSTAAQVLRRLVQAPPAHPAAVPKQDSPMRPMFAEPKFLPEPSSPTLAAAARKMLIAAPLIAVVVWGGLRLVSLLP